MNKTYRVIWNHSLRCFVAVSELCKNKKKSASIVVVAALLSSLTFSMNVQAQITDENSLDDEELQLLQTQLKHVSERIRSMASEPALDIESSSSVPSIMEVTNIGRSIDPNNTVNIIVKGDTPASVRMDINVWGSGIRSEHRTDGLGVSALKQDNAYQIAIGNGSYSGIGGTTLGSGASSGTGAVAVGPYVNAAGRASVGIGAGAYSGDNAVGIGSWSAATGNRSNALGSLSGATGQDSTAIGTSSMASGIRSIAFGSTSNVGSEADPLQDTVSNTNASGVDSIAIGTNAKSIADGAIAFGLNSEASVANGLAIGANAVASAVNSVALGADSIADRINSVSIGKSGATRQLVNVSAGTADQDATNVAQIKPIISALGGGATIDPTTGEVSGPQYTLTKINPITGSSQAVSTAFTSVGDALSNLNSSISNLSNSALRYVDATSKSMIMLGGDDGTTITNLKPGEVGVSSSDAVNGSQLFATNTAVAANGASIALNTSGLKATAAALGGGAGIGADGVLTAPRYAVQGKSVQTVGDALSALDGGIVKNSGDISSLSESLSSISHDINTGSTGLVQQDSESLNVTVAAATGGETLNIAGSDGNRVLSGVKAGRNSDDALNVGQMNEFLDGLGGTGAFIDSTTGKVTAPRFSIQGVSYNLGDSLAAIDSNIGSIKANASNNVNYDADDSNRITLGKSNEKSTSSGKPVVIANLANGKVEANSTEAVNGGQLYEVKNQVDINTSDIKDMKNNVEGIANGTVGLVQQDTKSKEISIGKDKGGEAISIAGADGNRVLTGLADGVADNDAVTVGQVKNITAQSSTVASNNSGNKAKAIASGQNSTAIGGGAKASAKDAVALGSMAQATGNNSIALGNGSIAERANTLSVGSVGGERQITNVARGTSSTDAVNVAQLNEGLESVSNSANQNFRKLGRKMDAMKDKLSGGVASAMAMGALPQPFSAGAGMMSMGGGSYNGESAIAIGASKVSENGKWVTKLQGSTNTQGDYGVSVGIGYQW